MRTWPKPCSRLSTKSGQDHFLFWGWYGAIAHHGIAWWLGITPLRYCSNAQLLRLLGEWRGAVLECADDRLDPQAFPLLQWSPPEGVIRLWGDRALMPEFRRVPGQSDNTIRFTSLPLTEIPECEMRGVPGQQVIVLHRRARLQWIDE